MIREMIPMEEKVVKKWGGSRVVILPSRKFDEGQKVFLENLLSSTVVIPAGSEEEAVEKEYLVIVELLARLVNRNPILKESLVKVLKELVEVVDPLSLVIPVPNLIKAFEVDPEAVRHLESAVTETMLLDVAYRAMRVAFVRGVRVSDEELEYFFTLAEVAPRKLAQAILMAISSREVGGVVG